MLEKHGALARRAAVAVGVSVALHLALVGLSGSLSLRSLFAVAPVEAPALTVDVVAGAARLPAPAAAVPIARSRERRPSSVALPPIIPVATEDEGMASPASDTGASTGVALAVASGVPDLFTDAAAVSDQEPTAPEAVNPWTAAAVPALSQVAQLARPEAAEAASALPAQATRAVSAEPPSAAPTDETASLGEPAPSPESDEVPATPDPRVNLARLAEVARHPSVEARAEAQPFLGRRDVFEFLLNHPDFATHVTRALRLARYRMWRTDDGFFVDDGWGVTGQVFVVQAASGHRVLYARGEFQSKLLPAIYGEAVVTINYDARPAGDGRDLLSAAISSQLKIDGFFGDLVATLANSLATEKAEKESRRLVRTFARVLQAVDETPAALYASLRQRPDVPRRELERFRALLKLP